MRIATITAVVCLSLCLTLGWSWATAVRGGTDELVGLLIWTLPLAAAVAVFALRPRFESRSPAIRVVLTTALGAGLGIGVSLLGYAVLGGWMLAWDFPVLYVWLLGATVSTLVAGVAQRSVSIAGAVSGLAVVVTAVSALYWSTTRPAPALLVTYAENMERTAVSIVHDSVLTEPHPSGRGRILRWNIRTYTAVGGTDSTSDVLLVFARERDRLAARQALAAHRVVRALADTTQ